MEKLVRIQTLDQLFRLNKVAISVPEDVFLKSKNGAITANAKSGLNLFALDLSSPILVESESQVVMDALDEIALPINQR